ncbi:MAG: hypothetical protein M5U34_25475 [Chloroflexi bacterium]|nr:hypothetical protein [Chloroflexota bacterium]
MEVYQAAPAEELPEKPPTVPMVEPDPDGLAQSVEKLKGVGPKLGEKLGKVGAQTIWELLNVFPRRYDDYSLMKPIKDLQYGEQITIIGTIWETRARKIWGNQTLVQSVINDGTGSVQASWFNQPWLAEKLKAGLQIVISGTVDQYLGRLVFNSPEWEPLAMDPLKTRRIVPVYPLTEGLNSTKMRDIMRHTVTEWAPRVPDILPEAVRRRQALYPLPPGCGSGAFPAKSASAA